MSKKKDKPLFENEDVVVDWDIESQLAALCNKYSEERKMLKNMTMSKVCEMLVTGFGVVGLGSLAHSLFLPPDDLFSGALIAMAVLYAYKKSNS